MLLLFDIGNTSVTYARAKGKGVSGFKTCLHNDIPKNVRKMIKSGGDKSVSLIISSVVPKITREIKKWEIPGVDLKLWIAGENLPVQIRHKYLKKKSLGIDRQVNLYGARRIYGAPLLVIDFGTAVTMDYLSPQGVFEGGLITPGPELSFQALINRAARIPRTIRLPRQARAFPGKDTRSCLSAGILHGYGAMTDELIRRFQKRYGTDFRVVMTGGFSTHLGPYCRASFIQDPRLCLKSLLLLYREHLRLP